MELVKKYHISIYNEDTGKGFVRHIVIRYGFYTDEIMVIFVTTDGKMYKKQEIVKDLTTKFKEIKSIIQNINVRETNAILGNKNFKMLASKGLGMEFNVKKVGVLEEKLNQALPLLTEEQTAYINGFFKILGKGDASGQKTQLKTYKFYFEEQLKKATDNFDKKGKMCNKLGLLCGIFLSILVI